VLKFLQQEIGLHAYAWRGIMKFNALLFLAIAFVATALAQSEQEFSDPSGRFKITLLSEWRPVSYSDAVGRQKVEFVYRDRSEGLLKITKESLGSRTLAEVVHEEEENLRLYRPGFELAGKEAFGGGVLRGMRLSFHYVEGGRRMAATYYFLQDGNSVWVLRFSGRRGSLDVIRNITDQMARSFRPL
jgi:hypothetical protein